MVKSVFNAGCEWVVGIAACVYAEVIANGVVSKVVFFSQV